MPNRTGQIEDLIIDIDRRFIFLMMGRDRFDFDGIAHMKVRFIALHKYISDPLVPRMGKSENLHNLPTRKKFGIPLKKTDDILQVDTAVVCTTHYYIQK